jgi:ABC-type transporter Mla MlaB component
MTKTSVSMPADLLAWTHAEAKKRDSSASRLICDLIELERRASVFVRLEALERKVREIQNEKP